ncbi:MAG: 2Fe-2S iron-sulfur cluster-binding protein [Planctomycetota bacterium]|jgi:ferredoxin|nr:2Fe-2S iron-sulfur cluster-binding protein [Planctomycetota bacterium]
MPKITVKSSAETKVAEGSGSLLDICYDNDLPVTFGCQSGKCGICTVKVVAGDLAEASKVEQSILEGFDCEPQVRLACQAHVDGDVTLESINE